MRSIFKGCNNGIHPIRKWTKMPLLSSEVDLMAMTIEHVVQYSKRLKIMPEKHRAREETSFGTIRVDFLRAENMSNSRGKNKVEDEESSTETPKDID